MELYDKAYFKALKEKLIPRSPIIMRNLLYVVISIIFFFVWINLIGESWYFVGSLIYSHWVFSTIGGIIAIALPIALITNILKNQNSNAYLIVAMIMFLSVIVEFIELLYYYNLYIGDPYQEQGPLGLINAESVCITCEINESIRFIVISATTIAILGSNFLGTRFKWETSNYYKAVAGAILIYGVLRMIRYF